ncbi:zinc finger MYM-type protein 1-like [Olea europaea var. sylvestris]|uniref:zinc finger MYM-type protein 1-like n=1 Tax=Olea europaea var. sylvestris TaxID=158386 RepID=UPI000C1CDF3D|nr:zinc finger MYM-type protein 1-like [Olea europaea var. sylvestris]
MRLTAVLNCTRFFLMQGLAFHGHNESKESVNGRNLIYWYVAICEEVKDIVFSNIPGNEQLISQKIQKDLVNYCIVEATRAIMKEIRDFLFSILVDEFHENSVRKQMTVVLRFVDKSGQSFEDASDAIFSTHRLSISSLRGQGFDGASNMSSEFNRLKALILKENPYALYVHCFAHQLLLAFIFVARRNDMFGDIFNMLIIIIVNLVISMFNTIIDILENISEDDDLLQALQKKDQNIQNAMALLDLCKVVLQNMGDNGWDNLLSRLNITRLNDCFSETTTELLTFISCLSLRASFAAFDRAKLLRLAKFYPSDFTTEELILLRPQLDKFLELVKRDKAFYNFNSIS